MQEPAAIFPILFILGALIIGVALLALWIWALVECITKEPSKGNDKIVWLLVVLLLGWLGALLYLGIRRPARIREFGE